MADPASEGLEARVNGEADGREAVTLSPHSSSDSIVVAASAKARRADIVVIISDAIKASVNVFGEANNKPKCTSLPKQGG